MEKVKTKSQEVFAKAKEAGLTDKKEYIKFKGTGLHIVKFLADKAIEGTNFGTGKPEQKMKYTFEENEETKSYETAIFKFYKDEESGEDKKKLSSFVGSMNDFDYGDTLKMEYTPIKGTVRGFIKIEKMNLGEGGEEKLKGDDIPIIEDSEEPKEVKKVNLAEGGEMNAEDIEY